MISNVRAALVGGSLVLSAGPAYLAQDAGSAKVAVTLLTERTLTDNPVSSLIEATSIGIICLSSGRPPATLAVVPADEIVEPFKEALVRNVSPIESPTLTITLPAGSDDIAGHPCDVVLFDDGDRNGRFDLGERYISAWTGGRSGYRVVYLAEPGPDHPGAEPGWNLIQGGFPLTYHPDLDDVRVVIYPVVEPIRAR